jgi:hypothetical protein
VTCQSCRVLTVKPDLAEFFRVLPSPAESCRVLPSPAESCRVRPKLTIFCLISLSFIYILGWKNLWDKAFFPWHKDEVNTKLVKNVENLVQAAGKSNPEDCRFFVPLCGKSKDLIYLRSQGFSVIGIEAVESACQDFFVENSIEFEKKSSGDLVIFEAKDDGKIKIFCGDYFKLTPEIVGGKFDCVWDRGSLVALPVEMRTKYEKWGYFSKNRKIFKQDRKKSKISNRKITFRYVEVMMNLVNPQFGYLLVSLERELDPPNAMPHSVSFDNVKDLYGT